MEMLAFPDIKTRGNGQNGKKECRQKKGMSGKSADIDVSARHVADMSPTFPTKDFGRGGTGVAPHVHVAAQNPDHQQKRKARGDEMD